MSGNQIANATIVNNTPWDLWVTSSKINSGHWNTAPITIPRNSTVPNAFVAQGTSGTATGTSGSVVYQFNDATTISREIADLQILAKFSDPYTGNNSASIQISNDPGNQAGVSVSASVPPKGSNVVFTYTITYTAG